MMKAKKLFCAGLAAALCASVLVGCGSTAVRADTALCQTELSTLAVPQNVQIIGLGEASHGVSEYQKLKAEVFQALAGHNGHIGKVSAAGYPCLGSLLAAEYGDAYFAIGTDAADTRFQSQTDTGFTVRQIKNKNGFTAQLDEISSNFYYLDFDAAAADANWQSILTKPQRLSGVNVGISAWQQYFSFFYTQTLIPADTYDGMIVFQSVSPSTLAA